MAKVLLNGFDVIAAFQRHDCVGMPKLVGAENTPDAIITTKSRCIGHIDECNQPLQLNNIEKAIVYYFFFFFNTDIPPSAL